MIVAGEQLRQPTPRPAPDAVRWATMETVVLQCPGWSRRVFVAMSFAQRLLGVAAFPPRAAILIPGRSAHGLWIGAALTVVGLDASLEVIGHRALAPRRVVTMSRARWLLELPWEDAVPAAGTRLRSTGRTHSPPPPVS